MRLFLDQMFRVDLATLLRAEGHDVVRAEDVGQARADDAQIVETASLENRVLVTLDEHFGDWVVLPLSKHPGVIRLKIHPTTTNKAAGLLVPLLANNETAVFRNRLIICSISRTRWIKTADD